MPRGSNGPEVVTIFWRDIPAQVNGQLGRERHQVVLPGKFQRAIDRAKQKAKIYTAEQDIAQWRRTSMTIDGDVAEAAQAEAARLEAEYSREYLGKLAYAGGFRADVGAEVVSQRELLALEELDESVSEAASAADQNAQKAQNEPLEGAEGEAP